VRQKCVFCPRVSSGAPQIHAGVAFARCWARAKRSCATDTWSLRGIVISVLLVLGGQGARLALWFLGTRVSYFVWGYNLGTPNYDT
jgi:hypothetical protein